MKDRLPVVDGLPGVAMLGVIIFHGWTESGRPAMPFLSWDWSPLFALGAHGASLFFALSGFCLMLPVLSTGRVPGYRRFVISRLWRVVPPYYLAVGLWLGFWALHPHPPDYAAAWMADWPRHLLTHLTFTHTLWVQTLWSLGGALWFVGVLMQFYLLFPLLARLVRRLPWLVLAVSLVGLALWRVPWPPLLAVTRLPFFIGGMAAAVWYARRQRPLPLLRPAGRILAWRPLRGVGVMSYSLLLYNFAGYHLASWWAPQVVAGSGWWWALTAGVLFVVAGLAYLAIERPLRMRLAGRTAALLPAALSIP